MIIVVANKVDNDGDVNNVNNVHEIDAGGSEIDDDLNGARLHSVLF